MVRVETEQYEQFTRAAKVAGKTPSAWLRELGAREVAPPVPRPAGAYLSGPQAQVVSGLISERGETPRKMTPLELAAAIPGVRLGGFGGMDLPVQVGNAPTEDVATKPWLPELRRLQSLGEWDPGTADEEFKALCPNFRPPKGWLGLSLEKRAAYLDEKCPLEAA